MRKDNPSIENILKVNPAMGAAMAPYVYKYQQFAFKTVILGDTVPRAIEQTDQPVELLLIQARSANAGSIYVWNETGAAGVGVPLAGGDGFTLAVDNQQFDMAEVLARLLDRANPFQRLALNVGRLYIVASAATQTADILFGYGPPR